MATGLARDEIANGSRTGANDSRTGALGRERFANGRVGARTGRQADNYSLKYTKALPSLRRATSPFSNSVLSLFWAVLFEMPGSIVITSPTPSSVPVDSKHLKTSFSPCLMRRSPSGESEAISWCSSIGKTHSSECGRPLYQSHSVIATRDVTRDVTHNISHISHNISHNMSDNEDAGSIRARSQTNIDASTVSESISTIPISISALQI